MSLLQRIKTPFADIAEETWEEPARRAHAVGEMLRDQRQMLGLALDDVAAALRIKPVYLAALEQGRVEDLPGPTYAVGFIRAYAQYLGLDAEDILESYKEESADVQARPDLSLPVPLGARSLPGGPILLVALILALCGYGTWYYLATSQRSRPERVAAVPAELAQAVAGDSAGSAARTPVAAAPQPDAAAPVTGAAPVPPPAGLTAGPRLASGLVSPDSTPPLGLPAPMPVAAPEPSAPAAAIGSAMPAATGTGAAPPAAASDPAAVAAGSGQVEIRALADCWIQVRAADDQAVLFSRVLKAGEVYRVPRPGLFLRTGNAGALTIIVDGKPAPAIGAVGTLRRNVSLDPGALLAGTAVHG